MITQSQNQGRQFEKDLAHEFGLEQIPGSGSVWHSKLDLTGHGARWSLKYTSKSICPLKYKDFVEGIKACLSPGGDDSIPIWAARIEPLGEDLIVMRKEDFKLLQTGHIKLIEEDRPQVIQRKEKSRIPELLRNDI